HDARHDGLANAARSRSFDEHKIFRRIEEELRDEEIDPRLGFLPQVLQVFILVRRFRVAFGVAGAAEAEVVPRPDKPDELLRVAKAVSGSHEFRLTAWRITQRRADVL